MKIKVRFKNTEVIGYYPDNIKYKNKIDINNKTIDGDSYIEITEDQWKDNRNKKMVVENGVYKEFVSPTLLQDIKSNKIKLIKIAANNKINANYPDWKQANYTSAVTEIHNKEIMALKAVPFISQYQLTAEEIQTIKDAKTCKETIKDIRNKSDKLEAALDSMTQKQLEAFDPTDDNHWI